MKKLSYEDIVFILENPKMGKKILGKKFGIDPKTIKSIRHGKLYRKEADTYNILHRGGELTLKSTFGENSTYHDWLRPKKFDLPNDTSPDEDLLPY